MAVYYVSVADGNDSYDGLEQTHTTGNTGPWKTVNKVNISTFYGDDWVCFKCGERWGETLTPPSAGSSGHQMHFATYWSGANPIISGADIITGWTADGNGVYHKAGITTEPRIVSYNGARLEYSNTLPTGPHNSLFAETFEAAGYDTAWTPTGTVYPDTATADAGSPYNWGSQCLKVIAPDNTQIWAKKDLASDRAIAYTRLEFVLGASAATELNDLNMLAFAFTSAYGTVWKLYVQRYVLGELRLNLAMSTTASLAYFDGQASIVPGRRYTVEIKYDFTNLAWAWRVDGVNQPNNVDSTAPITSQGTLSGSPPAGIRYLYLGNTNGGATYKGYTCYYDNVAMDATQWPEESLGYLGLNRWTWASNTLYVNVNEDPSTHALEAGQRDYIMNINGKGYVTLTGLNLESANAHTFFLKNCPGLVVDSCEWKFGGYDGMNTDQTAGNSSDPVAFTNNIIHGFGGCGIDIAADADYMGHITISGNTIYDNGWKWYPDTAWIAGNSAGIKVWGGKNYGAAGESDYVTIEHNTIYNQYDRYGAGNGDAIWVDQWGIGAIVRYNKLYNCQGNGLMFENMDGGAAYYNIIYGNTLNGIAVYRNCTTHAVYNNVCYGNGRNGLMVFGGSGQTTMTGNLFKNNISKGNGHNLSAILGGENAGGGSGNVYEYNCLDVEAANFIEWGQGVYKSTYAAWESAYGGSTHSVQSDPMFVDPANGNFHLQAGSPCIDTATPVGLLQDCEGNSVPS